MWRGGSDSDGLLAILQAARSRPRLPIVALQPACAFPQRIRKLFPGRLLPIECSLPAPHDAAGMFRFIDWFSLRVDSRFRKSLRPWIASRFRDSPAFGVMTMKRKRSIAAAILGRLGLELLPRWRLEHLAFSEHLRRVFRRLDVDLVLDVGANEGQFRDFLRTHVGYEGWVASFEPVADAFAAMETRAAKEARWRVFPVALGAADGKAAFHVSRHSTLSSFREPRFDQSLHVAEKRQVARTVEVEVRTLDALWPAIAETTGARRPYLKLDTQGFDLEVLRGSEAALQQVVALQFEASVVPMYREMPTYMEMISHLNARKFVLSDMFSIARDADMRLIEFDCVMIRSAN
jgi:FkbM family methyltransferase